MKNSIIHAVISILFLSSMAQANSKYLIKFKNDAKGIEKGMILKRSGLKESTDFPEINWAAVESLSGHDISDDQKNYLLNHPLVVALEKSHTYFSQLKSNDPKRSPASPISLEGAWDISIGSKQVIVAVSDTGVRLDHEDLKNQIWTNPKEIPSNGIDDDHNGFIDDVHGWNFAAKSANPNDDQGHGTHVSGIIGAEGNNNKGTVGVNWAVTIMPVKFLTSKGTGESADGIASILYAANNGAHVINCSWGSTDYSQALFDAIEYVNAKGVLLVAAAGNAGVSAERYPLYPAAYNLPGIISVASTNGTGAVSGFSNFGKTVVDVFAPGEDRVSTYNRTKSAYASMSGTSMASPVVAGVAALMIAVRPDISLLDLRNGILNSVVPHYRSMVSAGGIVSASLAVNHLLSGGQIWPRRVSVKKGQNFQFTAWGIPEKHNWSTSNAQIAAIDQNGVLRGLKKGETNVIVTTDQGQIFSTTYVDVVK